MGQFWLFTTPSNVKCASLDHKMFQGYSLPTIIPAKKSIAKLRRFSGSAGFSCCRKLILYGYHFRMDLKICRTVDQGRDKSCDAALANDAGYWEPDSLLTTAKATSSTVSFEVRFLFLLRITHKSSLSSNFRIVFFQSLPRHRIFSYTVQASIFAQCS